MDGAPNWVGIEAARRGLCFPHPVAMRLRQGWGNRLLLVRQRFHAGEFLAFEEFEAGAAAGGDVGDLVGYAGLVDGDDRIAAADDGDGGLVGGNGVGDGVGADGEAGELEDAGGAVPHDGAGVGDDFFDGRDGFGADVEALPVGGEVFRGVPGLGLGVGGEVVGEDVVDGQQQR